jgi:hypothetical protein
MTEQPTHLKALEEIERESIPGLVEVLREEGLDAVRHVLWDAIGWHRDYSHQACLFGDRTPHITTLLATS